MEDTLPAENRQTDSSGAGGGGTSRLQGYLNLTTTLPPDQASSVHNCL